MPGLRRYAVCLFVLTAACATDESTENGNGSTDAGESGGPQSADSGTIGSAFDAALELPGDAGTAPLPPDAAAGTTLTPNATYLGRANAALAAWNIGLEQDRLSAGRNLGGAAQLHNPPHWITTSGADCEANGVPDDMRGGECAFISSTTVGVCRVRFFSNGQIADSTALMLESFQDGGASEGDKQQVFTHEIGHCLGLRHTDSLQSVMFSSVTNSSDEPSSDELAAVLAVYGEMPPRRPDGATSSGFYTQGGNPEGPIYHPTLPVFTIDGEMGTSGANLAFRIGLPAPGPFASGLTTLEFHFQRNGETKVVVVKSSHR